MDSHKLSERVEHFLLGFKDSSGQHKYLQQIRRGDCPLIIEFSDIVASIPEVTPTDSRIKAAVSNTIVKLFAEYSTREYIPEREFHPHYVCPTSITMKDINPGLIGEYVRIEGVIGGVTENQKVFTDIEYICKKCKNLMRFREYPPHCTICNSSGIFQIIPEGTFGHLYKESEFNSLDNKKGPSLYEMILQVNECKRCQFQYPARLHTKSICPVCRSSTNYRIITHESSFCEVPNSHTNLILVLLGAKYNSLREGMFVEIIGKVEYHRVRMRDPKHYQPFIIVARSRHLKSGSTGETRLRKHLRPSKVPVIGYTSQKLKSKLLELVEL